ncbi:MAG: DNA/RNA nuclease SfsA [Anaerolineae bacterium]|nr:DNA/RNA nuclease SfsA [Anaerolineae bacterium]
MPVRLHDPKIGLREATFVSRENRFRVTVELGGKLVGAHLPNSGRLQELLSPGRRLWLRPATTAGRKTAYDVVLADLNGVLVAVDARLPNRLVEEALREGLLPSLAGYPHIRREVNHGESRLDFVLEGKGPRCLVEVKSVTLVRDGLALFPDAPTERGRRHVEELRQAVLAGERAAIIFVIQREDVRAFAPNDQADPLFGQALRQAAEAGVEVYAHACRVSHHEMRLQRPVAVMMSTRNLRPGSHTPDVKHHNRIDSEACTNPMGGKRQ